MVYLNTFYVYLSLRMLQVVEYILDRNACLLPAYFAITEIRKLYPEGQLSHWVSVCVAMCNIICNTIYFQVFLWIPYHVCASHFQLLGSLISDFVDSFRPTARINSICGKRNWLLPLLWIPGGLNKPLIIWSVIYIVIRTVTRKWMKTKKTVCSYFSHVVNLVCTIICCVRVSSQDDAVCYQWWITAVLSVIPGN